MMLATSVISLSQNKASDSSNFDFNFDLGIASRNIWRGLDYGSSPSTWGDISGTFKNFSIGAIGTTTLNGSKEQYGTWLELYASYKFKNISFVLDDYFFFNADEQDNNYFEYRPENTQHFVEARIEYENDYLEALVGYVVYSNSGDSTNGIYIETTYKANEKLSFTAGVITGAQWLSFYDGGGITTLAVNGHQKVKAFGKTLQLKASLVFNPNYANASPQVGNNPVYFVISAEL